MQLAEAKQLGLKILLFGGYGTGKTHFSSTLPQPIYFFDTDKGITTVANRIKNEKRDPAKELIDLTCTQMECTFTKEPSLSKHH